MNPDKNDCGMLLNVTITCNGSLFCKSQVSSYNIIVCSSSKQLANNPPQLKSDYNKRTIRLGPKTDYVGSIT